jgi:hypothetical protein
MWNDSFDFGIYNGIKIEPKKEYAKIQFVKLDKNKFQVNKLQNFMTKNDILEKYGYFIMRSYEMKKVCMEGMNNQRILITDNENNRRFLITIGEILSGEKLDELIKLMKKAGKYFSETCKSFQHKKIIDVEI